MKEKKKSGRPKGRKKTETFSIRLTTEEMEVLRFVQKRKRGQIGKLFLKFLEKEQLSIIHEETREIIREMILRSIKRNEGLTKEEAISLGFKVLEEEEKGTIPIPTELEGNWVRARKKELKRYSPLPEKLIIEHHEGFELDWEIERVIEFFMNRIFIRAVDGYIAGSVESLQKLEFYLLKIPRQQYLNSKPSSEFVQEMENLKKKLEGEKNE